jgi:hypothetical protein
LKISSLPTSALKFPNIFSCDTSETDPVHAPVPHKAILRIITFILSCYMHIQNDNITSHHITSTTS